MSAELKTLHGYWFPCLDQWPGGELFQKWFMGGKEFDDELRERFGTLPAMASAGDLDQDAAGDCRLAAAMIVALDQLPRNLYRGTPQAFATDEQALAETLSLLADGRYESLWPAEKLFALMPLEHSEDLAMQEKSVELFDELARQGPSEQEEMLAGMYKYAVIHRDIIAQFGRFPHRNKVLGRESTGEESAWLEEGGHTFGQ